MDARERSSIGDGGTPASPPALGAAQLIRVPSQTSAAPLSPPLSISLRAPSPADATAVPGPRKSPQIPRPLSSRKLSADDDKPPSPPTSTPGALSARDSPENGSPPPQQQEQPTAEADSQPAPPATTPVSVFTGPLPQDFLRCWSPPPSPSLQRRDTRETRTQTQTQPQPSPDFGAAEQAGGSGSLSPAEMVVLVFLDEGHFEYQYGMLEMSLQVIMKLGKTVKRSNLADGRNPQWQERLEFPIRRPFPSSLEIRVDEVGVFKETPICRGSMKMAPIYERGPMRCQRPGSRVVGAPASPPQTSQHPPPLPPLGPPMRQPEMGGRGPTRVRTGLGEVHGPGDGYAQWARQRYQQAQQEEWEMDQLQDMFPNYDADILVAIYSANAGDLDRTIAALLAMNIA